MQVYRKDLYDAKGLKPADTYDELVANAKALTDPPTRAPTAWRCAASPAPARTCTSTRRCLRGFGGSWMQRQQRRRQLARGGARAHLVRRHAHGQYAPPAVRNWNWPDIADAFSQGTVATYIDAHSSAAVINNPEKSKVVGKIAYARWPKGPNGKRVTSIWNWGFPINAALTDKAEEGDLAVHRLGGLGRDAGAHLVEVRRPGQALGRQPHVAVALAPSSPRR